MKKSHKSCTIKRKYCCIICKQAFKRCTNLRRHQLSRHGLALADPINSLYLDEYKLVPVENKDDKKALSISTLKTNIEITPGNVKFRVKNNERSVFQPHQQQAVMLNATPRWEKREILRAPEMPTTMNPNPTNKVWVPTTTFCQPQPPATTRAPQKLKSSPTA